MSPAMIPSRRRGTGGVRSLLNRVGMLAVVALCLAVIIIASAQLGRHFGLVGADFLRPITIPGLAGETPKPSAAALAEAGLLDPTDNPVVVVAPIVSPSPGLSPTLLPPPILSPSPTIISRPALHSGLWVPILMYHYIRQSPDRAGIGLSVLPADFEAQMQYLKDHGYNTVTMSDLDRALLSGASLPPKPVALTFDDGHADFYTVAAPVLQSLGMTATNYVPTMLIDGIDYMTWSQVENLDAQGFEMAAHSQFHVDVSKVSASRRLGVPVRRLQLQHRTAGAPGGLLERRHHSRRRMARRPADATHATGTGRRSRVAGAVCRQPEPQLEAVAERALDRHPDDDPVGGAFVLTLAVFASQALDVIPGAFGAHRSHPPGDGDVANPVVAIEDADRHPRVIPEVLGPSPVFGGVEDELVALRVDPSHGDVRAAVGAQRRDRGQVRLLEQLALLRRKGYHLGGVFAELLQRALLDLTHTLAGKPDAATDLVEGLALAIGQTEAQLEDQALPLLQLGQ